MEPTGLPPSRLSSHAISSAFASTASASRYSNRARSRARSLPQGLEENARRAAFTAASISAAPPAAIVANTWPVEGLITSSIAPLAAGNHLPPISNARGRCRKAEAALSTRFGATMAFIWMPPVSGGRYLRGYSGLQTKRVGSELQACKGNNYGTTLRGVKDRTWRL